MEALALIVYWGVIFACSAWAALSLFFAIFYLVRKENGNLWAFAFFNVIAAIVQAIVLAAFRIWQFGGITQYSSLIYVVIGALLVIALFEAIFGREPKEATA